MEAPDRLYVRVSLKEGLLRVVSVKGSFDDSRKDTDLTNTLSKEAIQKQETFLKI